MTTIIDKLNEWYKRYEKQHDVVGTLQQHDVRSAYLNGAEDMRELLKKEARDD